MGFLTEAHKETAQSGAREAEAREGSVGGTTILALCGRCHTLVTGQYDGLQPCRSRRGSCAGWVAVGKARATILKAPRRLA